MVMAIKGRLPVSVIPHHYEIQYSKIDLESFCFEGICKIGMKSPEVNDDSESRIPTRYDKSLLLHCLDLHILACKVICENEDQVWEAMEFRYHSSHETVEILFQDFPGWIIGVPYRAEIHFQGILNDQMRGFYRSTYIGLDGKQRNMATTQFEATDARRAFPCVDEPAHKATFQLIVTVPAHLQCISNTPFESIYSKFEDGMNGPAFIKTVTFQKTPKMSTYLLALVVGNFDAISDTSPAGIQTTVYTVPGKAHQGKFCLDTAVKCLDLYQDLFRVPYPLIKSDLLAIPDFAAGAMENWGCVTYREAKILVQEGSTSETMRRGIARTVCHELAHQWFGNLVTMEFWTQLWLNEGFARYMEFVAIDTLFPEWDAWTEFVQSVFGVAQSLDSMKSSHPVEVDVEHPDEINEIFDAISYAKGASLIRMISSYLGFDIFMEGLKIYLKRHAYGNATTNMLWEALEESSGKSVSKMMSPWTLEVGYPLLLLTDNVELEISRFLASGPGSDSIGSAWSIPITAIIEGSETLQGPWLIRGPDQDETALLLEAIKAWTDAGKWFKLNANQTAFIRVAYTPVQWTRLSNAMFPTGQLSAIDRLGLISDSFACGRSGYTSIVDSLRLVVNFGEHETADYAVWQELSENLSELCKLYRSQSFFLQFQMFLAKIYKRQFANLGWDAKKEESQRTGTMRATVISMMGKAGDKSVQEESYRRLIAYVQDGTKIPGDLQGVIFRLALRHDEAQVFPILRKLYEDSSFPEEQRNCLSAMGSVLNESLHKEMLEYTLFSGKVRLQDIAFPLNALSSASDAGGKACWNAFQTQHDRFKRKFASGPMWGSCVGLACRGLRTLQEAEDVESFFKINDPGSAKRRLVQGLEAIRTHAMRLSRDVDQVATYLSSLQD